MFKVHDKCKCLGLWRAAAAWAGLLAAFMATTDHQAQRPADMRRHHNDAHARAHATGRRPVVVNALH